MEPECKPWTWGKPLILKKPSQCFFARERFTTQGPKAKAQPLLRAHLPKTCVLERGVLERKSDHQDVRLPVSPSAIAFLFFFHCLSPSLPIYVATYIYMCYRLQKRGPIFGFIGSKTGPKFEAEMGNYNSKKNHLPPGVGLQVYVSRGAILTFARAPFVASITGPVCCTT